MSIDKAYKKYHEDLLRIPGVWSCGILGDSLTVYCNSDETKVPKSVDGFKVRKIVNVGR